MSSHIPTIRQEDGTIPVQHIGAHDFLGLLSAKGTDLAEILAHTKGRVVKVGVTCYWEEMGRSIPRYAWLRVSGWEVKENGFTEVHVLHHTFPTKEVIEAVGLFKRRQKRKRKDAQ